MYNVHHFIAAKCCSAFISLWEGEVMKKKLITGLMVGALACVGAFGLFGCGGSSSDSGDSADTSADAAANGAAATGTLIVGFDAEYPPYGYLADAGEEGYEADDGNTYTGFDLDLAKAVCDENGWELKVKPINWDSKDAELGSGSINCIWNGFTMEGREGQYTFSDAYMLNSQVVVVKAGSEIKDLDDLAGKNVLTQADSAASDLLGEDGDQAELGASFAGGAVQTIADYNNAFMQLESGQCDAIVCDLSVAMTHLNASPDAFVQLEETLQDEHYVVGLALGDDDTAAAINEALKTLDEAGTVKEIAAKYGDDIDYDNLWCLGK